MAIKTISNLNDKIWYRILKVIFILTFIFIISGYNLFVFSEIGIKNINPNDTTIICNLKKFTKPYENFSLKDIGLNLNNNDFIDEKFDYKFFYINSSDFTIKKIIENCTGRSKASSDLFRGNIDIYDAQKRIEIQTKYDLWSNENGDLIDRSGNIISKDDGRLNLMHDELNNYNEQVKGIYGASKAKYLDFNATFFDIKPAFSYLNFVNYFIFGNLLILLFFEVLRRAFYYVALGSLKPKKDN